MGLDLYTKPTDDYNDDDYNDYDNNDDYDNNGDYYDDNCSNKGIWRPNLHSKSFSSIIKNSKNKNS